jgi:transposase
MLNYSIFCYFLSEHIFMVFTDKTFKFFSILQSNVRSAIASSQSDIPYTYEGEEFFEAYEIMRQIWAQRKSQRKVAHSAGVSRSVLREWENKFICYGAIGLLSEVTYVKVDPRLESLTRVVRAARPHANSSYIVQLAAALQIPGATLELVYRIQRSHGHGQRLDKEDALFFGELQRILASVEQYKSIKKKFGHDPGNRAKTFIDFSRDPFQHRIELFKTLSSCTKKGRIREILRQFGIHSSRLYDLKSRYMKYGVWGLVDRAHTSKRCGEKISAELELAIIEERLMNPSLSAQKMIKHLKLKCSRANVQKIFTRWKLSTFKEPKSLRGIIATSPIETTMKSVLREHSAKSRFPNLIKTAHLKVNNSFLKFLNHLKYRGVSVSNPGAIIIAPFLDQLGVVEAIYTYGPPTFRTTEITNDIIVNILRIIAGFPTINNYMLNSDHSVAIGAGLVVNHSKSNFYRKLEDFRFSDLLKLRNDAGRRAKELNIVEAKEISIDYHCDPSDSRFPRDKGLSKSPDKNGDLVFGHRPQILWDSCTNSIINIAYCEGRSRAPTALYNFCEKNLFTIIDPSAIAEIYTDSEYTGERQLIYLIVRSSSSVTMCLKQNKRIKKWKEEILKDPQWQIYGDKYRIASGDYTLSESGKKIRFVVKQDTETNAIRCFGSTHLEWSPTKILDMYHIRWSVESGIKDLIENYFLNYPPGDSPEKVEVHYYCVMLARLLIDYFSSLFPETKWRTAEGWESVLSTIRTTIFSNQNCELTLDESGDLKLIYLDGDTHGIKHRLKLMLDQRKNIGLNKVSWWGNRGLRIEIKDQFNFLKVGPKSG